MFCVKCGAKLPEDSKFCSSCGETVAAVVDKDMSAVVANKDIPATPADDDDITAIIGKNAGYYKSEWNKRPTGLFAGANAAMIIIGLPWLAYRKMYRELAVIVAAFFAISFLALAMSESAGDILIGLAMVAVCVGMIAFANGLYRNKVNRVIKASAGMNKADKESYYRRHGGTSTIAALICCAAIVGLGIYGAVSDGGAADAGGQQTTAKAKGLDAGLADIKAFIESADTERSLIVKVGYKDQYGDFRVHNYTLYYKETNIGSNGKRELRMFIKMPDNLVYTDERTISCVTTADNKTQELAVSVSYQGVFAAEYVNFTLLPDGEEYNGGNWSWQAR